MYIRKYVSQVIWMIM